MNTFFTNIPVILAVITFLGAILYKFIEFSAKIATQGTQIQHLKDDLRILENQTLHALERIENKLDKVIMDRNG
jgi:hypothetical protein